MDPSAITTIIVGVLTALVPAAYTYLSGENRRNRERLRLLEERQDARDDRVLRHRAEIRLHNDTFHPDGKNYAPLPDLPEHMQKGYVDE